MDHRSSGTSVILSLYPAVDCCSGRSAGIKSLTDSVEDEKDEDEIVEDSAKSEERSAQLDASVPKWWGPSTRIALVVIGPIFFVAGVRGLFLLASRSNPRNIPLGLSLGLLMLGAGTALGAMALIYQRREEAIFGPGRRETVRLAIAMLVGALVYATVIYLIPLD